MVAHADIQAYADEIARQFHPQKIIMFGSHALGTAGPDSDVDLLVILPFDGTNYRKTMEILAAVRPTFAVDLIVRQPDDAQRRLENGDPLIREAITRGRVLFERAA